MDDFNTPDDLVLNKTIKRDYGGLKTTFEEARSHINKSKTKAVFLLVIISAAIIIFPLFYETRVFTEESVKKLQDYSFSDSYLFTIYLMGKAIGFLFLFSLFAWIAKIYNNLRRLEITYYDKSVAAHVLYILSVEYDFSLEIQHFNAILEPTLQQAEKQKQHDDEHHKHLANSVADLIDKIVESLKRK